MPHAYEEAGVSVEAGYEVVRRIKSHVNRTKRPGVMGGIGGFGGLFDLASLGYKEPVLISGTDGVGTKLMVASTILPGLRLVLQNVQILLTDLLSLPETCLLDCLLLECTRTDSRWYAKLCLKKPAWT